MQASASFDAHQGAHQLRTRTIPSSITGQPSTTIMLQPRGDLDRLPAVTILDARLQKDVRLGRGARVGLVIDALNLNNENAWQSVVTANVTSSSYQFPTSFAQPRRYMLSAKFSF
jgi:outer membrane receptor protein involved in Fe transport